MSGDSISTIALAVVLSAVILYALYWVVRKAVAAGIVDARESDEPRQKRRSLL